MKFYKVNSNFILSVLVTICALGTFAGCQEGPFIKISLDGRSSDIVKVKFSGFIQDTLVNQIFQGNSDLSYITVSLPAGKHGRLDVAIEGSLEDDCVASRGMNSVEIKDDSVYSMRITLEQTSTCGRGTYNLTVINDPATSGKVISDLATISCGLRCSAIFREGTPVQLTATPNPGFKFQGWSEASCGSRPRCAVTLLSSLTVRATYTPCMGWCNEAPNFSTKTLYSINGNSAENVVAVGAAGTILAWNGSEWVSNTSNVQSTLRAVRARRGTYFAVGDNGTVLAPMLGSLWSVRSTDPSVQINDIAIVENGPVFAVGSNGTYLYGYGMNFTPIPVSSSHPCVPQNDQNYNAISIGATESEHYIVGSNGLFMRGYADDRSPFHCANLSSGTDKNLLGLWIGSKNIYLVGETSTIVKCDTDGQGCKELLSGPRINLHGVWSSSKDAIIYAVGDHGTILSSNSGGMRWEQEESGIKTSLYAVWGPDDNTVYAVGESGIILRLR